MGLSLGSENFGARRINFGARSFLWGKNLEARSLVLCTGPDSFKWAASGGQLQYGGQLGRGGQLQ